MRGQKVAVVGSGISGLSAAWLLATRHRVTLYEQDPHLGGHTNSISVTGAGGPARVDTGFVIYNEQNYPNLSALFRHLGVQTQPSRMTFSYSMENGAYEYAGSRYGFFGQPGNLLKVRHWLLLKEIDRFFRVARKEGDRNPSDETVGAFLERKNFSQRFVDHHLGPLSAAIWSSSLSDILDFPLDRFVGFFSNHGLLRFRNRPQWRSVVGGSRTYIERLLADTELRVRTSTPVIAITRHPDRAVVECAAGSESYDHVVIGTHANQALALLADCSPLERELLEPFRYNTSTAVLHRDARFMPHRRRLWSSWNVQRRGPDHCTTYWMNSLQNLTCAEQWFVTLDPAFDPRQVEQKIAYRHPAFDQRSMHAQHRLWQLQGHRRTWFCGSYFAYGFHEDGLQSGLAVAEQLGGVSRPWDTKPAWNRLPALEQAKAAHAVTELLEHTLP